MEGNLNLNKLTLHHQNLLFFSPVHIAYTPEMCLFPERTMPIIANDMFCTHLAYFSTYHS